MHRLLLFIVGILISKFKSLSPQWMVELAPRIRGGGGVALVNLLYTNKRREKLLNIGLRMAVEVATVRK